jgi:hypothetical protein
MVSSEACGMKKNMNTVATAPSAKAMGIPENKTTHVENPKSRPI